MKTPSLLISTAGLLACLCLIIACDPDDSRRDSIYSYNVSIRNESNAALNIYGYRTKDLATGQHLTQAQLIHSVMVAGGSDDKVITIALPLPIENIGIIYPGFENNVDSLVVKFNATNKGYITKVVNDTTVVNNRWISGKSSLFDIKVTDLNKIGNTYYYNFSQQDYENAPEL